MIPQRSHQSRGGRIAAAFATFVFTVMLLLPKSIHAETVGMEITLKAAETLTLVRCSIQALPGQTVTGTLRDCITGGDGKPGFGPIGPSITPGGGSVTIMADGSYSYTAPDSAGTDSIPFTAIDRTLIVALPANVNVQIVSPLQVMSFILRLSPGATITGNLNDYVTGGVGNLTIGPVGVDMRTSAGGTITIAPDGTFTYTAPAAGETDDFEWFVIDESGGNPVESLATIVIEQTGTMPTPAPSDPPTVTPVPSTPEPDKDDYEQASDITKLPSTGHGPEPTHQWRMFVFVILGSLVTIATASINGHRRKSHA